MLNFDLRDTVAGQQIFDAGHQEGILKNARVMVIEALTERFVTVPPEMKKALYSVGNNDVLKELHRHAIRSPYIEDFKEILAKVLASSKTEKTSDTSA